MKIKNESCNETLNKNFTANRNETCIKNVNQTLNKNFTANRNKTRIKNVNQTLNKNFTANCNKTRIKNGNEYSNNNRWLILFILSLFFSALLVLAAVLPGCSLISRTAKISDEIGSDDSTAVSVKEAADVKSDESTGLKTNTDAGSESDLKDGSSTGSGKDSGAISASGSDTESAAGSDASADESIQENILKGFNKLLTENKNPYELIRYIDENIISSSAMTAGALFDGLENSQKNFRGIYMDYLFEGDAQQTMMEIFTSEEDFIKENLDTIRDIDLKKQLALIFDGGFKFVAVEGSFYPTIDYEYLKKYSPYLDEEYNNYLDIKAIESNEIFSRDSGLMISWDELAKRVMDIESYLSKYPQETPRKVETGKLYLLYLASYIHGQDNSPTRDYLTNRVYDEVIKSYKSLADNNPGSLTGEIIADYLEVLEKNSFILSDEILSGLDKYLKIPVKKYSLDSVYIISEQLKYLSYPSDFASLGYIILQNGSYTEKYDEQSGGELKIFLLDLKSIGDLNDDGINDAAVILVADPGGMETFYYLYAVKNKYSYIYCAAQELLGEWVKIESVNIKDGRIYVKIAVPKPGGPICCTTVEIIKVFQLQDDQLIEI